MTTPITIAHDANESHKLNILLSEFEVLLKRFGDNTFWDDAMSTYPCLRNCDLSSERCDTCSWPCLEKDPMNVITNILLNEKLRSEPGGHYADRLLTAISLGVPFSVIEQSHIVNLEVALFILGQTRKWAKDEATKRHLELYGHTGE